MFNKGVYVGHLEQEDIEERKNPYSWANPDAPTMHSITTQWMMAYKSNQTLLGPLIINWNKTLKQNLQHY